MKKKTLHEIMGQYNDQIDKLIDKNTGDCQFSIQEIAKNFFKEFSSHGKASVARYIKNYQISNIFSENGILSSDRASEIKFQTLGYFLLFAIEKYGTQYIFRELLPNSIVHETRSKLNPINFLIWIFSALLQLLAKNDSKNPYKATPMAWSTMHVNPKLEVDETFSEAFEALKAFAQEKRPVDSITLGNEQSCRDSLISIFNRISGENQRKETFENRDGTRQQRVASGGVSLLQTPAGLFASPPPPPIPPPFSSAEAGVLPTPQHAVHHGDVPQDAWKSDVVHGDPLRIGVGAPPPPPPPPPPPLVKEPVAPAVSAASPPSSPNVESPVDAKGELERAVLAMSSPGLSPLKKVKRDEDGKPIPRVPLRTFSKGSAAPAGEGLMTALRNKLLKINLAMYENTNGTELDSDSWIDEDASSAVSTPELELQTPPKKESKTADNSDASEADSGHSSGADMQQSPVSSWQKSNHVLFSKGRNSQCPASVQEQPMSRPSDRCQLAV